MTRVFIMSLPSPRTLNPDLVDARLCLKETKIGHGSMNNHESFTLYYFYNDNFFYHLNIRLPTNPW